LHVDLDEGAGQLLRLPRRARLAGTQPDDDVLDADRLAGPQGQVLDDAVALIEQAEDGDPFGPRRHARLVGGRARHLDGDGIALGRLIVAAAAGERGRTHQRQRRFYHDWSGVQAL
jgi:hypothetical protein